MMMIFIKVDTYKQTCKFTNIKRLKKNSIQS